MAKAHHKNTVISTLAASNRWLIGMLLMLVGIVFVVLYSYSAYKDVKGVSTKATEISRTPSPSQTQDNPSNGCFLLKGNVLLADSCGNGLYRSVRYICGDNSQGDNPNSTKPQGRDGKTKITGTPTPTPTPKAQCQTIQALMASVTTYCAKHTSCNIKNTPTPKVSGRPTPSAFPSIRPSKTPTPTDFNK